MHKVAQDFIEAFDHAVGSRDVPERRIGSEMKFPIVNADGTAASYETVQALWKHLESLGWEPDIDAVSGQVVGARKAGEYNDTVASCETGFCKVEFSFAHVGQLSELETMYRELREQLNPFAQEHGVHFLGYGMQPVTRPGRHLLMKKSRAGVWDRLFGTNRHIAPEDGTDMHLFTVNTASHTHLSVSRDEAVALVNALNGFSGAQLALTADSSVWRGEVDPDHLCAAEILWDWWMPDADRVGVPRRPFEDLEGYARAIGELSPVFVKREGHPVIIDRYETFNDYYAQDRATGVDLEGNEVEVEPQRSDLDLHNTCYWYTARISAYYTVENRANDQQPPEEVMTIPALTLGIASALGEATEEVAAHDWTKLHDLRKAACESGPRAAVDGLAAADLAGRMLDIARRGLMRRERGEERYLEPLEQRLEAGRCPADDAIDVFTREGIHGLLADRAI